MWVSTPDLVDLFLKWHLQLSLAVCLDLCQDVDPIRLGLDPWMWSSGHVSSSACGHCASTRVHTY